MTVRVTRSKAHEMPCVNDQTSTTQAKSPAVNKKGKGESGNQKPDTKIQMVATTRLVTSKVPTNNVLIARTPGMKNYTKFGETPDPDNTIYKSTQADAQSECSLTSNRTPAFVAVALVIGCIAGIWLGAKFFSDNTEKLAKAYQENKNLLTDKLSEECRRNTSQIVDEAVGQCQDRYKKVLGTLDAIATAKSKTDGNEYPLLEAFLATQENLEKQALPLLK